MEENVNLEQEEMKEVEGQKKSLMGTLIYPVSIALILALFAGFIYYNKVVRVKEEKNKKFVQNDYGAKDLEDFENNFVTLGKYKGLTCEITQEMYDEYVEGDTVSYEQVKRAAKDSDQVSFNVIGFVDGKKEKDLKLEEQEVIVGEDTDGPFKVISDGVKGKKKGDVLENVKGINPKDISDSGKDYAGKKVTFNVEIGDVSERVEEKITDEWVEDNYFEEMGIKTTEEYYDYVKEELKNECIADLWQQVVDGSSIKKYPDDAYARIIEEVDADYNYAASEWGMELDDYKELMQMTDEDMEKEYENELASEMISYLIAYKENLQDIPKQKYEQWWEDNYEEYGYEKPEDMKEEYTQKDVERAIILERAANFVYENATIKESYKIKK
ncbi:MAG: hypothetical protein K6G85_08315 [Eubacterium sp.]|nr:hypothetical protein [Eubacterium sp.]